MNYYVLLPLISSVFIFVISLWILRKNCTNFISVSFTIFCFSVFIWLFGTFCMLAVRDKEESIWWDRFIYSGVVFTPTLIYHFGIALTRDIQSKFSLKVGYLLSFVFLLLSRTNLFISDLFMYQWGVSTKAKMLHHVFLIFFSMYFLLFFKNIYLFYKKSLGKTKIQIKYFLLAFSIFSFTGVFAFLPSYGVDFYPSISYYGGIAFSFIIFYIDKKYDFFSKSNDWNGAP